MGQLTEALEETVRRMEKAVETERELTVMSGNDLVMSGDDLVMSGDDLVIVMTTS